MKHIMIFFSAVIVLTATIHAQTEVWRFTNRVTHTILEDGQGNAYILQGWGRDTVWKVNPNGTILWSFPMSNNVGTEMAFSGSGLYLMQMDVISQPGYDTLWYFDTSGVLLWTYNVPFNLALREKPQTDAQGNLIVMAHSFQNNDIVDTKLLKLGKDGNLIFNLTLPLPENNNPEITPDWYGPFINESNNVWMTVLSSSPTSTQDIGNVTIEKSLTTRYAYLFDGNSGTLTMKKSIFTYPRMTKQNSTTGQYIESYSYPANDPSRCTILGENLVVGGTLYKYRLNMKNDKGKQTEEELWQVFVVTPNGEKSYFHCQGKGSSVYTLDEIKHKDKMLNELQFIAAGNEGALYLSGVRGSGRYISGRGDNYFENVLVRYDPSKEKIVWMINKREEDFNMYFYQPAQKIFQARLETSTISIYDTDGNLNLSSLKFSDSVSVTHDGIQNIENGYYYTYLWHNEPGNEYNYVAKYSLDGLLSADNFTLRPAETETIQSEYVFSLTQNYPNPFNPTTNISFVLPNDALVTLKIYNIIGQEVSTLLNNEEMEMGEQEVEFNATADRFPSGVYFYRIQAQPIDDGYTGDTSDEPTSNQVNSKLSFTDIKKMILLR